MRARFLALLLVVAAHECAAMATRPAAPEALVPGAPSAASEAAPFSQRSEQSPDGEPERPESLSLSSAWVAAPTCGPPTVGASSLFLRATSLETAPRSDRASRRPLGLCIGSAVSPS